MGYLYTYQGDLAQTAKYAVLVENIITLVRLLALACGCMKKYSLENNYK